ncbi:MAG: hypothetical protein LV479_01120 [Methylacidiphilales bacterium]|nr:hypothetical protein [Candidatus Methylacidiphilales bacterium]
MVHQIELNLRDLNQLFNTIDPSPFPDRDLDRSAEDFILSWAQEFPINEPVGLIIYLKKPPEGHRASDLAQKAVRNYFVYRERLNKLEFKRLMRQGRTSLIVGLSFLGLCLFITEILLPKGTGILPDFIQQGLTIAGWVAMWRPMEIYLYDWWPLRLRGKIFTKLSKMSVEVRKGHDADADLFPPVMNPTSKAT